MDNKRPIREDPFGQRYLNDAEDVFKHNAWDEVEFSDEKIEEINEILGRQRLSAVEDEKCTEIVESTDKSWDEFYGRHSNKFFMDRKWLIREFSEVFKESADEKKTFALEVGCGAGNTTFPLLESTETSNPNLFVYCCDFSPNAVNIVKADERFNSARCSPFVWDITRSDMEIPVQENSIDYILCVYVLSALPPEKQTCAIANLVRLLKKDGIIYIKDYGRHDLTQLRFKKDRYIRENFYARGDGTLTYFFDANELHDLLTNAGLQKMENFVDKRMLVNRATKQQMFRRWIQCKYVKT